MATGTINYSMNYGSPNGTHYSLITNFTIKDEYSTNLENNHYLSNSQTLQNEISNNDFVSFSQSQTLLPYSFLDKTKLENHCISPSQTLLSCLHEPFLTCENHHLQKKLTLDYNHNSLPFSELKILLRFISYFIQLIFKNKFFTTSEIIKIVFVIIIINFEKRIIPI